MSRSADFGLEFGVWICDTSSYRKLSKGLSNQLFLLMNYESSFSLYTFHLMYLICLLHSNFFFIYYDHYYTS